MTNEYPLSILDHRISTLRETIRRMSEEFATSSGEEHAKLSARIAASTKELDNLVAERDILAADAR
jgi:uncharacterized small protein (DUF1192 family)